MPNIWQIIKKTFRQSYDYLGLVLGASLSWFAVLLIAGVFLQGKIGPPGLGFALALLALLFLVAPWMAGAFATARKIARKDDPGPFDLLTGYKQLFWPAGGLLLLDLVIATILLADLWFFLNLMSSQIGPLRFASLFMMVITAYAGALWGLGAIYHWPLLIEEDGAVLKVQKKAVLLALDNLLFTSIIAFVIILLSALLLATGVGAAFLLLGMVSVLEYNALLPLLEKYGILKSEPEGEEGN